MEKIDTIYNEGHQPIDVYTNENVNNRTQVTEIFMPYIFLSTENVLAVYFYTGNAETSYTREDLLNGIKENDIAFDSVLLRFALADSFSISGFISKGESPYPFYIHVELAIAKPTLFITAPLGNITWEEILATFYRKTLEALIETKKRKKEGQK